MDQATGNTNQIITGVVSTVASSVIVPGCQDESNNIVVSGSSSAIPETTTTVISQQQQQQQQQQRSVSVLSGTGSIGSGIGSTVIASPGTGGGPTTGTGISAGIATVAAAAITGSSGTTIQSATPSPILSPPGKIFGKNSNGTMVATSTPSNEAELQLYRVLQRASLLAYYDTLLEMGGDDVQQLVDAGEEEFLEIMALVGMASKPLHVRRLQKALHEWVNNPAAFQTPLPNTVYTDTKQLMYSPEPSTSKSKFTPSPVFNPTPLISTAPSSHTSHITNAALSPLTTTGITSQVTSSSPQLTPSLTEAQIARIATGAEKMARKIPQKEPRPQSSKKRTSRELEQVMAMSENDPRRMDEIRKYAAIYGRFDCKRRPEKPLTLHEVCVNEAAAQICKFIPALLTRRDELFPLARQLVKDAGFGHSASIARFGMTQQSIPSSTEETGEMNVSKRTRITSDTTTTSSDYKDLLEESRLNIFAMYQRLGRPFDLSDIAKFSLSRSECDEIDNDSRFSFSNSSSPPLQLNGSEIDVTNRELCDNGKDDLRIKSPNRPPSLTSPLGVQVISASGGHIIAVANPALAMSPALTEPLNIKRETSTPDI